MNSSSHAWTRRDFLAASAAGATMTAAFAADEAAAPDTRWALVKAQFPIEEGVAYLNTGTYGPSPRAVATVEQRVREAMNRNFNRFFYEHFIDERFLGLVDQVAAFVGSRREDIAFVSGATEGMNYIAGGLDFEPGDEVLTTEHEHQAGVYPWLLAARRRGVSVRQIPLPCPLTSPAQVLDAFAAGITPRTRVMSFCHVQYTDGARLPVRDLCRLARDKGILSVVDGAQSVGMLDFAVSDLECDLFATSLHKWACGPYGTGLIWLREDMRDRLWPTLVEGHEGWDTADRFGRDPGEPAINFAEKWTPTLVKYSTNLHYYGPLFWAIAPAIELQQLVGRKEVEARVLELAERLRQGLSSIPGARILSPDPASMRSAITSFVLDGVAPDDVKDALYRKNIIIRAVHHEPFGFNANRVSTHVFNDESEVDRLLWELEVMARSSSTATARS